MNTAISSRADGGLQTGHSEIKVARQKRRLVGGEGFEPPTYWV